MEYHAIIKNNEIKIFILMGRSLGTLQQKRFNRAKDIARKMKNYIYVYTYEYEHRGNGLYIRNKSTLN